MNSYRDVLYLNTLLHITDVEYRRLEQPRFVLFCLFFGYLRREIVSKEFIIDLTEISSLISTKHIHIDTSIQA